LLPQWGAGSPPDGRVSKPAVSTMEFLARFRVALGWVCAPLVLILAHRSGDNICVDTHVHRISNRLRWVATRTPEETEQALYQAVPRRWWPVVNLYLVTWGQNICRPVYPLCGDCAVAARCPKIGVLKIGKRKP